VSAASSGSGFDWRPIEAADAGRWSALLAALQAADRDWGFLSEQELLEDFGDPDRDFAGGSMAIYDQGVMIGYGELISRSVAAPVHEMRYHGGVHPAYRQRGLGGRLLEWAEPAAVRMHQACHPGHPLTLSSPCVDSNAAAVALHAAHGYAPARWFHAMVRELTATLPEVPARAAAEILGWTPERSEDARLIRNEAFGDHWGSTQTSAQSWAHFVGISAFRPAFSFLAYSGGEPAGLVMSHEYDAAEKELYIALLGTRRAARKAGIGSALLLRALSEAKAAGFTRATLGVDADSLTGAVGLYERAGFTVHHTTVIQAKELLRANRDGQARHDP
jgi:ribosomal protein S18 acetylase RimI-like enzyme